MSTYAQFVSNYFAAAYAAFEKYGIHPLATLAQAAKESGYGSSYNARNAKNFFGMTKGSGLAGEYWIGWRTTTDGRKFRVYPTPTNSFLDFGLVISEKYPSSAAVSNDLSTYADSIANSPYVTDADNRTGYKMSLISIGNNLAPYVNKLMAEQSGEKNSGLTLPTLNVALDGETYKNESGMQVNYLYITLAVVALVVPFGWLLATGKLSFKK